MSRRKWAASVCLALGLLLLAPRAALAHPYLLQASPAPDSVLKSAPNRLLLTFTEALNAPASTATVQNRERHTVSLGPARLVPGQPQEMEVRLAHLGRGSYIVLWTAVSGDDGHVVRGAFIFSVGARDPHVSLAASVATGGASQGFPDSDTLTGLLAHWLVLLATTLWIGVAAVTAFVVGRVTASDEALGGALRAQSNALSRAALLVLLLSSGAELVAQAHQIAGGSWLAALPGTALSSALAGQYGRLWLLREGIVLLAVLATLPVPTSRPVPSWLNRAVVEGSSWHLTAPVPLVLGAIYLYGLAASGHAASVHVGPLLGGQLLSLPIVVDWLHGAGVALWFGGQLAIVLVMLPVLRPVVAERRTLLLDSLDRFSPIAYAGVGLLLLSGPFNGAVHVPSWSAFFSSIYGRTLMLKLALVGLMLLSSAYTVYVLRPRLRRGATAGFTVLTRLLRLNVLLGAGVLLATSVLFFYPVPVGLSAAGAGSLGAGGWQRIGLPADTVHALAAGHHDASLILAATESGVFRRNRLGVWRQVLTSEAVWAVDLLPDDRTVIAGDLSGDVDVSHDGGDHWRRTPVSPGGVYAVTTQPGAPTRLVAGAAGGIFVSGDGGRHWRRTLRLRNAAGTALAWAPDNRQVLFAGVVASAPNASNQVFVSHDAGLSWQVFGHGLHSFAGIMSLFAARPGAVYAGTMGNAVWKAAIPGGAWRKQATGLPAGIDHVGGIVALPGRSASVFAATLSQGVYRSDDAGGHWASVSDGLPDINGNEIVLALSYAPRLGLLLAGTEDGVYARAAS